MVAVEKKSLFFEKDIVVGIGRDKCGPVVESGKNGNGRCQQQRQQNHYDDEAPVLAKNQFTMAILHTVPFFPSAVAAMTM